MKKLLLLLLLIASAAFLQAAPPNSVTMQIGKIKVRLDHRKRWNINRIELQGRLLCIDSPAAHYGMTYRPAGSPHFIGSGHTESGIGEEVVSIKFFADGKEVVPGSETIVGKNSIGMEKVSKAHELDVRFSFEIKDGILSEYTEVSAGKDVKIRQLYCSMHPWSTRFTDFYAVFADGEKLEARFKSDEKNPTRKFAPFFAWYDQKSGLSVVTGVELSGYTQNPGRTVWDRKYYRKDYVVPVANGVLPAGKKVICKSRTAFFLQKDAARWKAEAEKLFLELK